jgi:hypothetical protein
MSGHISVAGKPPQKLATLDISAGRRMANSMGLIDRLLPATPQLTNLNKRPA